MLSKQVIICILRNSLPFHRRKDLYLVNATTNNLGEYSKSAVKMSYSQSTDIPCGPGAILIGSDLFFQISNSWILWSSKNCFPSLIKLSVWDKSEFAGCSLKDTKCVMNYFRGCQVYSTITNSGLIQAKTFSFENIVGVFRRSNSQRNFFIIIFAFSDISVDDVRKRMNRLAL